MGPEGGRREGRRRREDDGDFFELNSPFYASIGKTAPLLPVAQGGHSAPNLAPAPYDVMEGAPLELLQQGHSQQASSCYSRVELLQQGHSQQAHASTQPSIGTAESDAVVTKIATRSSCYNSGQL